MTTYTPIANSEIDQDSPVTQPLMTALRDNPIAIAEGASGAPQIQTAAIQDAAVQRAKLATGTSSAAGSAFSSQSVTINLSPYSFFPSINTSATGSEVSQPAYVTALTGTSSAADSPRFVLRPFSTGIWTYSVAWRFINV